MNDTRLWAGRIRDRFYIDLAQLGTVNAAVKNGTPVDPSAWHAADARNSFADTTVESIIIEVSKPAPAAARRSTSVSGAPPSYRAGSFPYVVPA
jgi:hypothetical protein